MAKPTATALIVAAGSSQRMGFDKLAAPLAGKTVLWHTVNAFERCAEITSIEVIGPEATLRPLLPADDFRKLHTLRPGGAERHLSVWNGLRHVQSEFVAVHDGARPLIRPETIAEALSLAQRTHAVVVARRITETLKRANQSGIITENVDRSHLWAMETPQVFLTSLLRAAYEKILAENRSVTDEASAVQPLHPVHLLENHSPNPKITFPGDLSAAERLF